MARTRSNRIEAGTTLGARRLETIAGDAVDVPSPQQLVHLQLRRFAGCPVCSLHLRSIVRRHDEIEAAGIREVVVFHSSTEDLRAHAADLPFAVVADPDKILYVELGAEASPRALLDPRAWPTIVRSLAVSAWAIVRHGRRPPSLMPHGGRYGLPADFLVSTDGRVLASHYGRHADDQWSVDELLALATATTADSQPPRATAS